MESEIKRRPLPPEPVNQEDSPVDRNGIPSLRTLVTLSSPTSVSTREYSPNFWNGSTIIQRRSRDLVVYECPSVCLGGTFIPEVGESLVIRKNGVIREVIDSGRYLAGPSFFSIYELFRVPKGEIKEFLDFALSTYPNIGSRAEVNLLYRVVDPKRLIEERGNEEDPFGAYVVGTTRNSINRFQETSKKQIIEMNNEDKRIIASEIETSLKPVYERSGILLYSALLKLIPPEKEISRHQIVKHMENAESIAKERARLVTGLNQIKQTLVDERRKREKLKMEYESSLALQRTEHEIAFSKMKTESEIALSSMKLQADLSAKKDRAELVQRTYDEFTKLIQTAEKPIGEIDKLILYRGIEAVIGELTGNERHLQSSKLLEDIVRMDHESANRRSENPPEVMIARYIAEAAEKTKGTSYNLNLGKPESVSDVFNTVLSMIGQKFGEKNER